MISIDLIPNKKSVQLDYVTSRTNTQNFTTYTFSNVNVGAANNRMILVVVGGTKDHTAQKLTSMTINGATANLIANTSTLPTLAMGTRRDNSNASVNISLTFDATMDRCYISVYNLLNVSNQIVSDSAKTIDVDFPISANINVYSRGISVAAMYAANGTSLSGADTTWANGYTEYYDDSVGTSLFPFSADTYTSGARRTTSNNTIKVLIKPPTGFTTSHSNTGLLVASWA